MADACPIPTAEERRYDEVVVRVTAEMKRKVATAIEEAHRTATVDLRDIGSQREPPSAEFLVALAEESLMLRMCGATLETDMVGKPAIAKAMAQNLLNRAGRWQSILEAVLD